MGKLTKQQQQMILAAAMMVFGGGYVYWNYMLKPTMAKLEEHRKKYKELEGKIETAQRQASRLPHLIAERDRLNVELAGLEKQLPKDKDVPSILRIISKQAMQEDLEFNRLTPKAAVQKEYFEILGFEVQFTGRMQSLARFLASLGQEERIFQAQNLIMAVSGGANADNLGVPNLTMTFTILTYAYKG